MLYFKLMSLSGKTIAILNTIINKDDSDLNSGFDVLIKQDEQIRNFLITELNIDLNNHFYNYCYPLNNNIKQLRYSLLYFLSLHIKLNVENFNKLRANVIKEDVLSEETFDLFNLIKQEELENYFNNSLKNRLGLCNELNTLLNVLKEEYLFCNNKEDLNNENLYNFLINEKRPFGNKNIKQSIAFNLNWDKERRLTISGNDLIEEMKKECDILFNELSLYLKIQKNICFWWNYVKSKPERR